jgi:DNA-binding MurR/RpiR family transcriptional regulator
MVRNMINGLEDRITKTYAALTKSQKKAAEYILSNPEEVAFLSLKALSEKAKVSDATIMRLSYALGFTGFSELQEILQSWLKGKFTPSEKLRSTRIDRRANIYEKIFEISVKNILKAQEDIPTEKLEEAVNALDRAKRIFVVGLRRSHSFAFHLYNNLNRILDHVTLVEPGFGFAYDQIRDIGRRDILVSISFSRYAKEAVEITRFAKKKRAFIVAITDNPLSPVGQLANTALCVDYGSPFFFGSHASTLVLVDCLLGGLSLKHKRRYVDALTGLENTLKGCGVWIQ